MHSDRRKCFFAYEETIKVSKKKFLAVFLELLQRIGSILQSSTMSGTRAIQGKSLTR